MACWVCVMRVDGLFLEPSVALVWLPLALLGGGGQGGQVERAKGCRVHLQSYSPGT